MPPKTIILLGAPSLNSLDWDESLLLKDFTEPFIQFLHLTPNSVSENVQSVFSTSADAPAWRSLPLEREHLTTGISQDHAYRPVYHGPDFFTATAFLSQSQFQSQSLAADSQMSVNSVEGVVTQFYEHSYAIHADVPSSQIAPHDTYLFNSTAEANSFTTRSQDDSQYESLLTDSIASGRGSQIPIAGNLTSLKDLPTAKYIVDISPQTKTVNLIVGIISVGEPREVITRQGGRKIPLREVVVGDETKSGFGVTFWLSNKDDKLREFLDSLRIQDIVLMKNIALGSFQQKVHGQSLRQQGWTKCSLLYREKLDRRDVGGCYGRRDFAASELDVQLAKTKRVKEWVASFVGVAAAPKRGVKRAREELPPDTQ